MRSRDSKRKSFPLGGDPAEYGILVHIKPQNGVSSPHLVSAGYNYAKFAKSYGMWAVFPYLVNSIYICVKMWEKVGFFKNPE